MPYPYGRRAIRLPESMNDVSEVIEAPVPFFFGGGILLGVIAVGSELDKYSQLVCRKIVERRKDDKFTILRRFIDMPGMEFLRLATAAFAMTRTPSGIVIGDDAAIADYRKC
jgi:hypothetical protein